MYFDSQNLQMAVLARLKMNGLGEHWGVRLPNGMVAHNSAERGEHVVSYAEFARGQPVRVVRQIPFAQTQLTIRRIHQELAQPVGYDLLKNNCEIFANRVSGGKPESKQVNVLLAVVTIGALMFVAAH